VGVVDGNVIRVISRVFGRHDDWWQNKQRNEYQKIADQMVKTHDAGLINQALMDLGATICTPKKVACLLCPWQKFCIARKTDRINDLPQAKPRKKMEAWSIQPEIKVHRSKEGHHNLYYLTADHSLPFLKKNLFFPSKSEKLQQKPTSETLIRHTITHHQIFIQKPVICYVQKAGPNQAGQWYSEDELQSKSPSILTKKILEACKKQKLFDLKSTSKSK
ncbi:MAG: hypothetical protein ACK5WZ_10275, partial [Pseudobdellovibrionaceae bacterium]